MTTPTSYHSLNTATIVAVVAVAASLGVWGKLLTSAAPAPDDAAASIVTVVASSTAVPTTTETGVSFPTAAGKAIATDADVATVLQQAAATMGGVRSVEFGLQRTGAMVYIDQFERLSLDEVHGQFVVPGRAQAEVTVGIGEGVRTKLGAVAIGDEVWLSNPVTGRFDTLPDGYDINPSNFFNPQDGWQPLLTKLADAQIVARDDTSVTVTGTAPAAEVTNITLGLIRGNDVPATFDIDTETSLVTSATFATPIGEDVATWDIEFSRYNASFIIKPPAGIDS